MPSQEEVHHERLSPHQRPRTHWRPADLGSRHQGWDDRLLLCPSLRLPKHLRLAPGRSEGRTVPDRPVARGRHDHPDLLPAIGLPDHPLHDRRRGSRAPRLHAHPQPHRGHRQPQDRPGRTVPAGQDALPPGVRAPLDSPASPTSCRSPARAPYSRPTANRWAGSPGAAGVEKSGDGDVRWTSHSEPARCGGSCSRRRRREGRSRWTGATRSSCSSKRSTTGGAGWPSAPTRGDGGDGPSLGHVVQADDLRPDRRPGGGDDDRAARAGRWRAQLGLPLHMDPGRLLLGVRPPGPGVHGGGEGVPRVGGQ